MTTRDRILDAALLAFGTPRLRGDVARRAGGRAEITKQTILYY